MVDFQGTSHEKLVELAQGGAEEAEEFLIKAYKDLVRAKARTYFIMGADGEDVVQEGMIGLFKAIKSYSQEKETSFKTYASLCINRQIIDAIKMANRKKHSPLNSSISLNKPVEGKSQQTLEEVLIAKDATDPEVLMEIKDMNKYIELNEEKIFSKMEVSVWKEYMAGRSYNEIAISIGKNQKSIYNAMERMKKKIICYLAEGD